MYIENKQIKKYISSWLALMFWIVSTMIIVGGLTRLTDSGLSITEWQLFSGLLPPFTGSQWENYFYLYKQIPEFKLQNFSMSIEEFKIIFWWEWIHRFLGRLIGLSFLIPLIYFSLKIGLNTLKNLYYIFFLICFQGFIGWYMVSSGLTDRVDVSHFRLSIHLLVAFFILSLIFWNYLNLKDLVLSKRKLISLIPISFLILLFCQIAIGAFVSGMDAGRIYNSWPLMGTTYFPNDSKLVQLFTLKSFSDPSLVQFMHRNLAYLILVFYLLILLNIYKKKMFHYYKIIKVTGFLLLVQIILGIITLLYGAQIMLASLHQISSIFLINSSVYFLYINTKSN